MKNEDALKRKCVNWMKKNAPPQFWFYCPTDHFYSGIPDIIFCALGRFGAVELKALKGKVSPIQGWTHTQIEKAGGQVFKECRSFDEFKKFIMEFFYKNVSLPLGNKNG